MEGTIIGTTPGSMPGDGKYFQSKCIKEKISHRTEDQLGKEHNDRLKIY